MRLRDVRGQSFAGSWATKKNFEMSYQTQFQQLSIKQKKMENFSFDCYNTLTNEIAIIEFIFSIIDVLVSLSFYTFFYFILFYKINSEIFSFQFLFLV